MQYGTPTLLVNDELRSIIWGNTFSPLLFFAVIIICSVSSMDFQNVSRLHFNLALIACIISEKSSPPLNPQCPRLFILWWSNSSICLVMIIIYLLCEFPSCPFKKAWGPACSLKTIKFYHKGKTPLKWLPCLTFLHMLCLLKVYVVWWWVQGEVAHLYK